jgi:tetratricopeptide (TPR) repeat protein
MRHRSIRSAFLASIIIFAASEVAQPQSETNDCTMAQMQEDARSVIEPCTRLLQTKMSAQERGLTHLIRGRGYHRSGQVALAAADYDEALKLVPQNEEVWLSRSNAAVRLGDWKEGRRYLAEAYRLNPNNARVLVQMGWRADKEGRRGAYEYYTRALRVDPAEPFALLFRSRLQFRARQFEAAWADADALIALDPKTINRAGYLDQDARMHDFHIVALAHRASMHEQLAQHDRAEQDLDAAIAYKRSTESLTARGYFLTYRPGRLENALADLNEATTLDPTYRAAAYAKGLALVRLHRFNDAFDAFDAAIAISPNDASALFMRARMHRQFDRTEEAVKDMWDAIRLDPFLLQDSMPALRHAGYWTSRENPKEVTQELVDAIHACMIDKTCN